ncbi:hypothetical protein WJ97_10885 [Burkholderia ubonensis]|nr:hypothetical protein WJ97_10885 [Burkholderia ubonensis]
MQGFRSVLKQYSYLPAALYSSGLVLYGIWAGMEHIHWTVPFIMAGISFLLSPALGNPYPAFLVSAVAVGLADYDLSLQLGIAWYAAALIIVLGMGLCVLITWAMSRLGGVDKDAPAAAEQ